METIEINKWSEFREHVDKDAFAVPVYWRGQANSEWPLASAYEREILSYFGGDAPGAEMIYPYGGRYKRVLTKSFYDALRDRYLSVFKNASIGCRGSNPAKLKKKEWWALGRHYGLITPFLDWTESPYIAAFFPLVELLLESKVRNKGKGGGMSFGDRKFAIYRLIDNDQLQGDGLSVIKPRVQELGRMQRQRGLFTWLDSAKYLELEGFLKNTGRANLLTKYVISDNVVMDGLSDLREYGISWDLLYPDLYGAAMHANTRWDVIKIPKK